MIDRFSRWIQAVPLENIEAETIALAFTSGWISAFGCPSRITSDRGTQFESRLFSSLLKAHGIARHRISAYNPKANGMIERVHRQLKAALRANEHQDWVAALPIVLLGMHTAIKEDIGFALCKLLFGDQLQLPGDMFDAQNSTATEHDLVTSLRKFTSTLIAKSPREQDHPVFIPQGLDSCTHVYVRVDRPRTGLQPPYKGPFPVVSRNAKSMVVKLQNSTETIPHSE